MPTFRVLSLGAGVQSSTLLRLSLRDVLPRLDCAIFADTRGESRSTYAHLVTLQREAEEAGIPVVVGCKGDLRADMVRSARTGERVSNAPMFTHPSRHHERRGQLMRKCTRDYKVRVIRRALRWWLGLGRREKPAVHIEQWIGISTDETHRMKASDVSWITHRWPLAFDLRWSRARCEAWHVDNGLPVPPRSACTFCPMHSNAAWRQLRDESPEEWAEVVEFEQSVKCGLSGTNQGLALHESLKPINEAPIDNRDNGELFAWRDECDGMCGL